MTEFQVNKNSLNGTVPSELGLLTEITKVGSNYQAFLSENSLTSSLPTQLGQLVKIKEFLSFQRNTFEGVIPTELGRLSEVVDRVLFDESNSFEGPIPSQFGNLVKLTTRFQLYNMKVPWDHAHATCRGRERHATHHASPLVRPLAASHFLSPHCAAKLDDSNTAWSDDQPRRTIQVGAKLSLLDDSDAAGPDGRHELELQTKSKLNLLDDSDAAGPNGRH